MTDTKMSQISRTVCPDCGGDKYKKVKRISLKTGKAKYFPVVCSTCSGTGTITTAKYFELQKESLYARIQRTNLTPI